MVPSILRTPPVGSVMGEAPEELEERVRIVDDIENRILSFETAGGGVAYGTCGAM